MTTRIDCTLNARNTTRNAFPLLLALAALVACDTPRVDTTEQPAAPAPPPAAEPPPPAAPTEVAAAASPLSDPSAMAELGKPAPGFTLTGVDGKPWSLEAQKGKTVVIEWFNPDCPFMKYAHGDGPLSDMAEKVSSDSVEWVAINSGAPGKQGHGLQRNQQAQKDFTLSHPILLDESGVVGRTYGAKKTPHMFVVDAEGKLAYAGALDNAPIGTVDAERPRYEDSEEGATVNYVQGALDDLAAGKPLRLPETPAYGCSVKYGS